MAIFDFPTGIGITISGNDNIVCDISRNDQIFQSSRSRVIQSVIRGDPLWQQEFSVITEGAGERAMQSFLDKVAGSTNTVRMPDWLAEIEHQALALRAPYYPYLSDMFFTPTAETGSPLSAIVVGVHTAGADEVSINANQGLITLRASRRVQIGTGFYRITDDVTLAADGTGTIGIYPELRTDIANAVPVILTGAKALWKMIEAGQPDRAAPFLTRRNFKFIEDIRAVLA